MSDEIGSNYRSLFFSSADWSGIYSVADRSNNTEYWFVRFSSQRKFNAIPMLIKAEILWAGETHQTPKHRMNKQENYEFLNTQ